MTTKHATARAAAVGLSVGATLLALAGPASADVPVGWSDPEPVSPLHSILIFVGIPLLLAVLIALYVYLPPIIRGESIAPAGSGHQEQWFGGPRELESSDARAIAAREGSADDETGGASGTW